MTDPKDWNTRIIDEFRANQGRVGPPFEGAPLTLVHHRGRKSGRQYVTPVMYLPSDDDSKVMYIFASKNGAPENPSWYHNLVDAGSAEVEVGTDTFPVSVSEVTGTDRDRVFAEQARRYPGFGEYAEKTAGIRTIPVLALRRV
jgi:deazaflavin-dependent oxidoreductase (nitroreductase family)